MRERKWPRYAVLLTLMAVLSGCGAENTAAPDTTPTKKEGPTITLGGFDFPESTLLVEIYGQALENEGYTIEKKTTVGNRETVAPALYKGDLDFVPEYLNTFLEFLGGEGTSDVTAAVSASKPLAAEKDLAVLTPSPAQNKNEFVVTRQTAEDHNLSKISDLAGIDQDLVLGGPAECPERPLCLKGLQETYGLNFDEFKPLDAGGPITVTALDKGEVDVALLFTTDGAIAEKDFVVLEDDKRLQGADNIVPVVRTEITDAYDGFVAFVDSISAKFSSEQLQEMNKKMTVDKEDPDRVATEWLTDNGFLS